MEASREQVLEEATEGPEWEWRIRAIADSLGPNELEVQNAESPGPWLFFWCGAGPTRWLLVFLLLLIWEEQR